MRKLAILLSLLAACFGCAKPQQMSVNPANDCPYETCVKVETIAKVANLCQSRNLTCRVFRNPDGNWTAQARNRGQEIAVFANSSSAEGALRLLKDWILILETNGWVITTAE
jgi:hypothetical protein